MLKNDLLDILACPKCKGSLKYQVEEGNDKNGALICYHCQLSYRVEDDIPVMLIDEATALDALSGEES